MIMRIIQGLHATAHQATGTPSKRLVVKIPNTAGLKMCLCLPKPINCFEKTARAAARTNVHGCSVGERISPTKKPVTRDDDGRYNMRFRIEVIRRSKRTTRTIENKGKRKACGVKRKRR